MLKLFDLKTGEERDYRPQMAFYALGLMQKYGEDADHAPNMDAGTRGASVE